MRAIQVGEDRRFHLIETDEPVARGEQVVVRVDAISINRGEVLRARASGNGFRPGWDFAGVVHRAVARGGPAVGTRVVGFRYSGAWAEYVAVSPTSVAVLPDNISVEQAATLPVAGLTALGALDCGGSIAGRRVLVTGASGGVGSFAVNIAAAAGADVTAVVRRPAAECQDLLKGAARIFSVSSGLKGVDHGGPYDLIIDTLGGPALGDALEMLTSLGRCVVVGVTDTAKTSFDAERFFMAGNATMQGYVLFRNGTGQTPAEGLERLLRLATRGSLDLQVGLTANWTQTETVSEQLISRQFLGKAVLRLHD
jgi:NADPH:quinone reductase-like Zn-dependent oxidoreductase